MKKIAIVLAATGLSATSALAFASNPILGSLKQQGIEAKVLAEAELGDIKGAALISGQPTPSVTVGLKTHRVTYKRWGSQLDYSSYNYMGNSWDTKNDKMFTYEGTAYNVAGDRWLADMASAPNVWNAANAQQIEYHYQLLDANTLAPTTFAFRESVWNRPITKFSW